MNFDEALTILGDFGPYQKRIYTLLCLPCMLIGMQLMQPLFILAAPEHRCKLLDIDNDTYSLANTSIQNVGPLSTIVRVSVPLDGPDRQCLIYVHHRHNVSWRKYMYYNTFEDKHLERQEEIICKHFHFDNSTFIDTVATELDLVCSRSIFRAHGFIALNVGSLAGFVIGGVLADRYGRKKNYIGGLLSLLTSSLILLWLPNVYVFIFFRLLIGISFGVFFNAAFIYALEFIGPSRRTLCGLAINHFWAVGMMIHAGMAYGIRSWRYLQLATALPYAPFLVYFWENSRCVFSAASEFLKALRPIPKPICLLPESPRWLLAKGRVNEAKDVLIRMAKTNKVDFPVDHLVIEGEETAAEQASFWDLFKSRILLLRTSIIFLNWWVVCMLYYGLTLNINNLAGSIHTNYLLTAVVEFIAYTLCIPGLYWTGRKTFSCLGMMVGGVALICTIFPELFGNNDTKWTIVTLSMLGKLGVSGAFATIYLYSAEMFPTVVRNSAMGACAFLACLGSICAPYIVAIGDSIPGAIGIMFPLLVFGVAAVVSGLLALILPETKGKQLPDTLKEFQTLGRTARSSAREKDGSLPPAAEEELTRLHVDS